MSTLGIIFPFIFGYAVAVLAFQESTIESVFILRAFLDARIITFAIGISFVAIVGKLIGCRLGATGLGSWSRLIVGAAMIPRGEVGIIVSALGLSLGAISYNTHAALLFTTIATAVCAPPILNYLARRSKYAM